MNDYGVIRDEGTKCFMKGLLLYTTEKITEEEMIELENDYDPIEAPPGFIVVGENFWNVKVDQKITYVQPSSITQFSFVLPFIRAISFIL